MSPVVSPALGAIQWTRPLGLLALVLPLVVLLASLRRERPEPVVTGTFALWARLASAAGGERSRRRVPPARWLMIAALALGAVALGGPREPRSAAVRRLRVLVDRSPSMYLPCTGAEDDERAMTRLASALARLDVWLAEQPSGIELEWCDAAEPARVVARGALPDAWRRPPARVRCEGPEPWAGQDRRGVLWLTDQAPVEPRHAGLCASGGAPVPGPVAWTDTEELSWDGATLVRRPLPGERSVAIRGELPTWLRAFVLAWAAERGLRPTEAAAGATDGTALLLEVRAVAAGPEQFVRAARDGWWIEGEARAAPLLDEVPCRRWLDAGELPVVTYAPGRVWIGLAGEELPGGDPAAFAVSWSDLLDGACVAPAEVVALDERRSAGPARFGPPVVMQEGGPGSLAAEIPLEALLAGAAFVLAVAALLAPGALSPARASRARRGGA